MHCSPQGFVAGGEETLGEGRRNAWPYTHSYLKWLRSHCVFTQNLSNQATGALQAFKFLIHDKTFYFRFSSKSCQRA